MSLRYGSLPVVVGSSVDMASFFLKTHDLLFIDRPRTTAGKYTGFNYSDMIWSPYGAYFRQVRKFCKTEFFSPARLRAQEHIRETEVRAMMRDLYAAAGNAAPVRLMDHLFQLNINIISIMVLGKKHNESSAGGLPGTPEGFKWMIEEFFSISGRLDVGDMIPWLSWLDLNGHVRRVKKLREMLDPFLDNVVEERSKRRLREGKDFVAMDAVDMLLELADDPNLEAPIQRDGVKAFTLNLLVGLPDTTSVTVEWAMSELLRHPRRARQGHRGAGPRRQPRAPHGHGGGHSKPPVPGGRHQGDDAAASRDAIASAPAVARGRVCGWVRHPGGHSGVRQRLGHRPGPRHLGARRRRVPAGTVLREQRGRDGAEPGAVPFGSGRRMCPGFSLGLRMVHVLRANLVHGYSWKLPHGVSREKLSMEETFGLTVPRKDRLPAHLYAGGP